MLRHGSCVVLHHTIAKSSRGESQCFAKMGFSPLQRLNVSSTLVPADVLFGKTLGEEVNTFARRERQAEVSPLQRLNVSSTRIPTDIQSGETLGEAGASTSLHTSHDAAAGRFTHQRDSSA